MKNIPYGRQQIDQDDIDAVIETLKSDFLTQGPKIEAFEKAFAAYVDVKYAVAVSNATAGLHIANMALGVKEGDRIITTPITFAASANASRYCGAEVWFADIDPDTYLLDIDAVETLIESKPQGFFTGIVPVDFAGLPVDLEKFRALADKHHLWIIEDAAHSPGGYFIDSKGVKNKCGNGKYADIAVFSFHPVKHIACGEGGMVTTNDKKLYELLKLYRSHGITKDNMSENHGGWYYEMQALGYNYRLTDMQAALGLSQLAKNPQGVERRNEIATRYKDAFKDSKIKYQVLPEGSYNSHHLFVIEVEDRKGLYDYLRKQNIFAQIHYIPLHTLPFYKEIGYGDADLSNSENYYKHCISLPMYPSLMDEEQQYVIDEINNYYK
ncbi:UDP-4-amino-4,6-dideoxy-N-acetyl-beta-L-altrosamine transaminase [Gelidibacter japonicus]|uniref:UDP-4-amino-4, 6-dideoxy-N-acetyl-beta-L-altrosamine transaminase n=1 Tax=Gelidibacter japonicus TaxID=1962232 RepID=UPI00202284D4|nr:UDP-4-amino-4,6-dideoxy-N-acetyl-beta-L-altrosamine transaminase [Gelidibacter japonicus]MCL8006640.1 UDP-4-amino-4,6-dideoxy-N-acetyl-beta-L-altrosamine transaminase [Gelidibacter japonicus]